MRVLIDTNIALRYVLMNDAHHEEICIAIDRLVQQGHDIVIVPQVIYEFWAVASRPTSANGIGWNTQELRETVDNLLDQFSVAENTPQIFPTWLDLVSTHSVSGKPTHDARLAAAYLVHGFDALLTRNPDDFKRFGLNVIHPKEIS